MCLLKFKYILTTIHIKMKIGISINFSRCFILNCEIDYLEIKDALETTFHLLDFVIQLNPV